MGERRQRNEKKDHHRSSVWSNCSITLHYGHTIDGQKNNSTINKTIKDLCETYKDLLQYGRKMSQKTVDSSLDFDENESLLEIFSNTTVSGGKYQFQDSVELSQLYMAMFSCSSVYTPFISYAGSSEYKAALRKLAKGYLC